MADEWWKDFFRGTPVELWLKMCRPEVDRAEAAFLEEALRLPAGGRVLDVPCGAGRHSIVLAERGFQVTGVDLSSEFLAAAMSAAADRRVDVRWEQREMRDLPWPGAFDAAFCFGNSFAYLDHGGNVAFLRAAAEALRPGGRFAIDTGVIAESLPANDEPRRWFEVGEIIMLIENRYDCARGRLDTDYYFIRGAEIDKRAGSHIVYRYGELVGILSDAGFGEFEAYSSVDRTPFALGSQRLLLVCTRG
jgi:SAM-dependent methyltransferase